LVVRPKFPQELKRLRKRSTVLSQRTKRVPAGVNRLLKKARLQPDIPKSILQGLNRLLKNSIFDRVLRETSLSG